MNIDDLGFTTGQSWIYGDQTLGMQAETEDISYPLYNKVSLPRMILAQIDSINYTKLLSVHGKAVTKHLEFLYMQNQQCLWYTLYIVTFILLREASHQSLDRYRHARENHGAKVRPFSRLRTISYMVRSDTPFPPSWKSYMLAVTTFSITGTTTTATLGLMRTRTAIETGT